eukprot:11662882-Ditylum_brightwellii.AAC.1
MYHPNAKDSSMFDKPMQRQIDTPFLQLLLIIVFLIIFNTVPYLGLQHTAALKTTMIFATSLAQEHAETFVAPYIVKQVLLRIVPSTMLSLEC